MARPRKHKIGAMAQVMASQSGQKRRSTINLDLALKAIMTFSDSPILSQLARLGTEKQGKINNVPDLVGKLSRMMPFRYEIFWTEVGRALESHDTEIVCAASEVFAEALLNRKITATRAARGFRDWRLGKIDS